MNNSMISSMVAMNGMQKRLDLIADNVANVNTVGYKSKEATFEDTLTRVQGQADKMQLPGRSSQLGFNLGFGAKVSGTSTVFTQGPIQETGLPTDVAIQGNALFAVEVNGNTAWTREGDFQIHPDPADSTQAYLTTSQGYRVLNTEGQPIKVPAGSKLQITPSGSITAVNGTDTTDAGVLKLDYIQRPDGLQLLDNNLIGVMPGASVNDILVSLSDPNASSKLTLEQMASVTVKQGALEQSNVDLTKEMTDTIQVQRAYQLSSRALTSSDEMMGLANHLRG